MNPFPFITKFVQTKEPTEYKYYPNGMFESRLVATYSKNRLEVDITDPKDLRDCGLHMASLEDLINDAHSQLGSRTKHSMVIDLLTATGIAFGSEVKYFLSLESDEVGVIWCDEYFCLLYVE